MLTFLTFSFFTLFVATYTWYKLKKENLSSKDGYFLGGRSLTGVVIAGSMLLTNISTEHLIGMNGSSYKNGFIIIAWEVTSSLALIFAALYFVPKYLKMGLITIPQFLESRFEKILAEIPEGLEYFFFCIHNKRSISYHLFINWSSSQNQ